MKMLAEMACMPAMACESLNHGLFEWDAGSEKVKYEPFFSSDHSPGLLHCYI